MTTVVFASVIVLVVGAPSALSLVVGHSTCEGNSIIHDFCCSMTYASL